MGYEVFDHTADIGIRVWGESLEDLFETAGRSLLVIAAPRILVQPIQHRHIMVEADDLEALLVNWLSEILYLLYVESFFPVTITAHINGISTEIHPDIEDSDRSEAPSRGPKGGAPSESGPGLSVEGVLSGEIMDRERRSLLEVEIKAVTYHLLKVERLDCKGRADRMKVPDQRAVWFAQFILDI
ncbi:MAG: archease [Firmicutes bacterium]|nr:archease [Bacillota bacterium]